MKFKFIYHDGEHISGAQMETNITELMNIKHGLQLLANSEDINGIDRRIAQKILDELRSKSN